MQETLPQAGSVCAARQMPVASQVWHNPSHAELQHTPSSAMRAAGYARSSSENQRDQSIEDQARVCRTFASREQITILENHI